MIFKINLGNPEILANGFLLARGSAAQRGRAR